MPKKRLLLFLFIIISLGIMTYQSNRMHFLPLKFLNNTLNIFLSVKESITSFIASPINRMLIREEENKRLKEELSSVLREQEKYQEALQENKKLKEILSIKEREQRYITAARVIGKSVDQWSNTLILDKGSLDRVTKDMTVITEKGLAGKIIDVSDSYSYLLLISDINFSAAARLQENRTEGIISGTGFKTCKLKYISSEEEIREGGIVKTSGLDDLFPPGIPIGYVSRVNRKGTGIFQDIEVIPFVDSTKIEFVAIVKNK
jgi:rod shape-determining protein MreC